MRNVIVIVVLLGVQASLLGQSSLLVLIQDVVPNSCTVDSYPHVISAQSINGEYVLDYNDRSAKWEYTDDVNTFISMYCCETRQVIPYPGLKMDLKITGTTCAFNIKSSNGLASFFRSGFDIVEGKTNAINGTWNQLTSPVCSIEEMESGIWQGGYSGTVKFFYYDVLFDSPVNCSGSLFFRDYDFHEFAALADKWLMTCLVDDEQDYNCDGNIDLLDLQILTDRWAKSI